MGGGTVSKFPSNIIERLSCNNSSSNTWNYNRYKNPIDLTKVSSITIVYSTSVYYGEYEDGQKGYYDEWNGCVGISVGNTGSLTTAKSFGNNPGGNASAGTYATSGTVTIDTSTLTGEYYIGCGSNPSNTIWGSTGGRVSGTTYINSIQFNK